MTDSNLISRMALQKGEYYLVDNETYNIDEEVDLFHKGEWHRAKISSINDKHVYVLDQVTQEYVLYYKEYFIPLSKKGSQTDIDFNTLKIGDKIGFLLKPLGEINGRSFLGKARVLFVDHARKMVHVKTILLCGNMTGWVNFDNTGLYRLKDRDRVKDQDESCCIIL